MSLSTSNSISITSNLTSTAVDSSGICSQESAASSSIITRKHIWVSVKSKICNTYLFLDKENMRYTHLMRQVATEGPYKLGYGLKEKKWAIVISNLNGTRSNVDKNLFGEEGVSEKAVKTRFFALMT